MNHDGPINSYLGPHPQLSSGPDSWLVIPPSLAALPGSTGQPGVNVTNLLFFVADEETSGLYHKHFTIVSDATIWNVNLEWSVTLPDASFTISAVVIYDRNTFIVQAT